MLTDGDALMNERINSLLNNKQNKHIHLEEQFGLKNLKKKDNLYQFYNIPEKKSNHGTTLGYGKKCNYSQIIGCGSNQLYAAPSYFDPKQHNAPVYFLGVSRPQKNRKEESFKYDRI